MFIAYLEVEEYRLSHTLFAAHSNLYASKLNWSAVRSSNCLQRLAGNLFEQELEENAVALFCLQDSFIHQRLDLGVREFVAKLRPRCAAYWSSCSWSCATLCHRKF